MLRTVTPATAEPVTIEEAKAHLRVTHALDDDLIAAQISSARHTVELQTGIALAEEVYLWAPESCFWRPDLPLWPATVQGMTYWDGTARVALTADDFRYDALRGRIVLTARWDEPEIAFTATPDPVPEDLKSAIKLRVMAEYEADPDEAEKIREASLRIAHLRRRSLGV